MAIQARRPAAGLIVHSDRGSQYASDQYQAMLTEHGFVCSMSRKGNCWDTQSMMSVERLPNLTRAGIGLLPLR
jgi:putative transposase